MQLNRAALAWAALSLAACGSGSSHSGPPHSPPATQAAAPAPASDREGTTNVNISSDILKACGMATSDARFAYDSERVRNRDGAVLEQLARCFHDGPLAGRQMRLVGHADPRGGADYNLALGGRRAESVRGALAAKGLDAARVSTTSRGEWDAKGEDETSWAEDRRVDVHLAD
jgi:peptidoglycan-associated lipoprotein